MRERLVSFKDLDVYQNAYRAMISVVKNVISKLPESEKYDLKDQLSRSCKAVPRLIAEGYAKKHQKFGYQKYLSDAMAESNETGVGIEQAKDLYFTSIDDVKLCNELIDLYDKISRQLYKLNESWQNFRLQAKKQNIT
jgi:four helix bundle protein